MGESEKISMGRKGEYEMEFYWSKEADVVGFGEGKVFLSALPFSLGYRWDEKWGALVKVYHEVQKEEGNIEVPQNYSFLDSNFKLVT